MCTIGDVFENVKPDNEKNLKKDDFRASIAPEDEYKVAVAMPERYTTAKDMKSWLERAVDGKNATEQMSFTRSKLMILM